MTNTEKTLEEIHWTEISIGGELHVSQMKTQEVIKTVQPHWNPALKEGFVQRNTLQQQGDLKIKQF